MSVFLLALDSPVLNQPSHPQTRVHMLNMYLCVLRAGEPRGAGCTRGQEGRRRPADLLKPDLNKSKFKQIRSLQLAALQ